MGLIREPLDVDFTVGHRRVTQKELDEISEIIRNQKQQNVQPKLVVPAKRMATTLRRKKVLA
jgi:hypothetical protein